jgi:hypothetical protein
MLLYHARIADRYQSAIASGVNLTAPVATAKELAKHEKLRDQFKLKAGHLVNDTSSIIYQHAVIEATLLEIAEMLLTLVTQRSELKVRWAKARQPSQRIDGAKAAKNSGQFDSSS